MIKAVLFDFDGVLTIDKTGSTTTINYIANTCNIPLDNVKANYYKFNKQLLLGETTHQEIWQEFCESLGQSVDYDILLDSFRETRLDERMIALVKELKEKYLIGMVTDNKYDRISTILNYRGLNQYFDVVAISASVHSGKESRNIFDHALNKLNVNVNECVFIDNTEKNLIVPKQMGMSTILFNDDNRDHELFRRDLQRILISHDR
ncbi:MAG: HAD family hydrolase [Ruminococcaceae bacterium]|nr:HAD family hydrolase [Oscillospiraceae bacterium]